MRCLKCFALFAGSVIYLLMPIAPGGAQAIYDPSPSHSVLGCSGHSSLVGPLLFQLCFSGSVTCEQQIKHMAMVGVVRHLSVLPY